MWRHRRTFEGRDASGVDLWFRFDFLIEADVPASIDDSARALCRRAEQHFPPQFHTVWVDMAGAVTMAPPAEVAEAYLPEDKGRGRDFNLNPHRWQVLHMQDHVPWIMEWPRHCEQAAQRARAFIVAHEAVREHMASGMGALQRQHRTRVAQLKSRIARVTGAAQAAERRDLDTEGAMHALLTEAIRQPAIRTDVAGAFFISATKTFAR